MSAVAEYAEYTGIIVGGPVLAMGYMWFVMEGARDLAGAARLAWRAARFVFLAAGWVGAVAAVISKS